MDAKELERFVNEYVKALNSQNVDQIERYHADNSETMSAGQPGRGLGRAERKGYFAERQQAFPDFRMTASKINADPNTGTVTFEWQITATHKGHFKGVPATNKKVTHHGTTELVVENGKIVRETSYQDLADFMKQLGVQAPKEPHGKRP
jgi:steroid delta-isomerase-like uncharacterized protein